MRTVHVNDIEALPLENFGFLWRPVRATLGVEAFGINAYTSPEAGGELIEEHDETGGGAGKHEELYVVLSGHARFTVAGREVDAPAGTLVFCDEPAERRSAVGLEAGTTVLAIGGRRGQSYVVSAWEYYFRAFAVLRRGDEEAARRLIEDGLAEYPQHASMQYNAACLYVLVGEHVRALEHLQRAIELDPGTREWARDEADFDPIRSDPAFPDLS
jgi:hypothetical protein